MGYKLAIDFGTTNSVIAEWDEASARGRTLNIPLLSAPSAAEMFLIPTLLYVRAGQTGEAIVGQAVRAQGLDQQRDNRLFRNFKRTLNAEAVFDARLIDGAPWTEAQAGQIFLRHLLEALPYRAQDIDQLVITVPVAAFDEYTAWLSRAIENIPAEKIHIVDESTAAALGYAVTEPGALVLVIDFGGGTLDLSLVRLPEHHARMSKARVLAKTGVSLGGSDIDQWLLSEIMHRTHLLPETLGAGYAALLSACEQAKIALSMEHETILQYTINADEQIAVTITRAELEALLSQNGLLVALQQALEKVMGLAAQKGVYREDIQHVLLVGGTALIPSVQQTLDEYFRAITHRQRKAITQMPTWPATTWKIENTSIRVDKPFTAVVEGALQVSTEFDLDDQLAHGYGLRVLDSSGTPHFDEVIPMGSPYPSRAPTSVTLAASHSDQIMMEFVIGQITTDALAADEINFNGGQKAFAVQADKKVQRIVHVTGGGSLQIKLVPPGQPGEARVRVDFSVDVMRRLRLSVSDLKTRKKLLVEALVTTSGSSPDQAAYREARSGCEPALARRGKNKLQQFIQSLVAPFKRIAPEQISAEAFLADLRSDDALIRFDAAEALARRGDREARLAFEDILKTGTPHQRASAARHLHRFSWFTAEPLFQQALSDEDARVREAAVFALCKMRLPEAYHLATDFLQGGSDPMLLSAVWGMYSHPDPAAVPVLAITLRARNPEIRALALEVLGATESTQAIEVVRAGMADADPEVQYAAALSWVELARAACFAELAEWIKKTRGWSRRWILRGLFHATNYMRIESGSTPDAHILIRALEEALRDDLPQARRAAFLPLAWMRHPEAETVLIAGFHNEADADTKAHMLTAAVHLMSPAANILLAEARQSHDPLVRQTAEFLERANKIQLE